MKEKKRTSPVHWQIGTCEGFKLMRTKIHYSDKERYEVYMVKPDSREKPISFMFMLPDFADASKDIRIGFANKGKTDPRIRIEWSLDKIDNSVGFRMDSRLDSKGGLSVDLFYCFLSHDQILLNFWVKDGSYYIRRLPLGDFKETYLRLLE